MSKKPRPLDHLVRAAALLLVFGFFALATEGSWGVATICYAFFLTLVVVFHPVDIVGGANERDRVIKESDELREFLRQERAHLNTLESALREAREQLRTTRRPTQ